MAARATDPVSQYLESLPADRRAAVAQVRDVVNASLPPGYEEGVHFRMLSWYIPKERYPETYNGQPLMYAALASQKQYMSLYLLGVYGSRELEAWFRGAFAAAGKKLDMGKSCVRFRSVDALPLDVIGEAIRRMPVDAFIAQYEAVRAGATRAGAAKANPKPAAKAKPAARAGAKPAARAKATASARVTAKPAVKAKPAAKAKPAGKSTAKARPAAKAKRAR